MERFRLLVSGGGTGGHISPGLAVIEALRGRLPGLRVLWVGASGRKEEDIVPRHDIPLRLLKVHAFRRSMRPAAFFRNMKTLGEWVLGIHLRRALQIMDEFRPDFVLGTGGYVCAPVLVAARRRRIRSWILEQNSVPGLTVRWLSRVVDVVGVAYEDTRRYLPASAVVELVGNPVSGRFLSVRREDGVQAFKLDPSRKTLLVSGGSLGSGTLNRVVRELLSIHNRTGLFDGWQVLHGVGSKKYDAFIGTVEEADVYHPLPYIYDMPSALAAADIVVCRAGAMTLAEVTARGVPSIVIPWPGAVRNHQVTNARELERAGASVLVYERDASGVRVAEIFRELKSNPAHLASMAEHARRAGHPEAARKVADFILSGVVF